MSDVRVPSVMAHGCKSQAVYSSLLLMQLLITCPCYMSPPPPPATGYYQGFLEKVLLPLLLPGCAPLFNLERRASRDVDCICSCTWSIPQKRPQHFIRTFQS